MLCHQQTSRCLLLHIPADHLYILQIVLVLRHSLVVFHLLSVVTRFVSVNRDLLVPLVQKIVYPFYNFVGQSITLYFFISLLCGTLSNAFMKSIYIVLIAPLSLSSISVHSSITNSNCIVLDLPDINSNSFFYYTDHF